MAHLPLFFVFAIFAIFCGNFLTSKNMGDNHAVFPVICALLFWGGSLVVMQGGRVVNKISLFCRLFSYVFFLLLLAQPQTMHGVEIIDGEASPSPDLTVFPWGVPQFTDDTLNTYPRPAFVIAACRDGGAWITNDTWYGWQPGLDDDESSNLTTNRLLIQFDRALVTNNLWIAASASGDPDAVLLVGLYDTDRLSVADPIILHPSDTTPGLAMSGVEWFTNRVDLSQCPSASILSISTTNGLMRIFNTVLYRDGKPNAMNPTVQPALQTPLSLIDSAAKSVDAPTSMSPAISAHVQAIASSVAVPLTLPGPATRYVDAAAGADSFDGTAVARVAATSTGPKKTIAAALAAASPGDTICVAAGTYSEKVQFGSINMVLNGRVVLQ